MKRLNEAFFPDFVITKTSAGRVGPDAQPKRNTDGEDIDVDAVYGRLRSARKRTEKEVVDTSRGKTKTGINPNKKWKTGARSSSITQKTANSASKPVTIPKKVRIKK